jgi:hypothetical protein
MKLLKIGAIGLAVIIVVLLGVLVFVKPANGPTVAGDAISSDGNLAVKLPAQNQVIASPVAIEGTVTNGGWFFEGSFPITVMDSNGTVLGQGTAQALSDWMSADAVPFSASIVFTAPTTATGTIVFMNDNPSGMPENQRSLSLSVRFH